MNQQNNLPNQAPYLSLRHQKILGRNRIASLYSGFARTPLRRRAQAKIDTNPTGYVLIAIDISKNRHDILIAVPGKKRRRRITLMNTFEDYRRLIDLLNWTPVVGQEAALAKV